MIKQLSSDRMMFFTFSLANLYWPELHRLMPGENTENANLHYKNLVDNPYIVAWFFNKRFKIFFNDVLKKH